MVLLSDAFTWFWFWFSYNLFSLRIKVFCNTLNRTSISIFVIPDSPEMLWRKNDTNVIFSIYDIMMTTATEKIFTVWMHYYGRIRCKNKVNVRRWMVCKMVRFVNNLSITRGWCNGIKFVFNIVTSIKRIWDRRSI